MNATENEFEKIILEWMDKEFKNKDAMPKVLVSSLAAELASKAYVIHSLVDKEYDLEDIDYVAENRGEELTDEERQEILERYRNIESHSIEDIEEVMSWVLKQREKKE